MRVSISALLCTALLFLCSSSWAQEEPTKEEADWASYFVLEEVLLRGSNDADLGAKRANPQPTLILEASEGKDTQVKARIGVEMGKQFILALKVESPKKSEETTLASLDGLTDSSTAELDLTWMTVDPTKYADDMLKNMAKNVARKMKAGWEKERELAATQGEEKPAMTPEEESILIRQEVNSMEARFKLYAENPMSRSAAMEALSPELYREAMVEARNAIAGKAPFFLTASAKAGPNEFRFVDSVTLEPGKENHTSRKLSAEVGTYLVGRYYLSLSYGQGKTFSAGRTAEICVPFGKNRALECGKFTVGSPKEKDTEDLAFEFRRLFKNIGFAARFKRDLENDVTGVELPIYFLQKLGSSEMELNGGVAIKWRSDTKDYAVSAFIGPALSTVLRLPAN
ncbi:MAG TPA: hypothetical protein VKK31_01900 [Thermoanaerobaculia bacterium]|nr:hypothetical protein [Thermoanaerobaculia bacterium]